MPSRTVQLVGGFYADDTRPWASQDCVNYLPVKAEAPGTRSEWMWRTAPGLKPFVRISNPVEPEPEG